MASYGQFETSREVVRTGLGVVWSARPKGQSVPPGQEKHAVKLREAIEDFVGAERARELIEEFLGRAEAQIAARDASGLPAGEWGFLAPIHDKGPCDEGAYIVTDLYPRSVRWLAQTRAPVSGPMLARFTSGVLGALRQFEKAGRVHGNVKPSNVFLAGAEDLALADIKLDDPLPKAGLTQSERDADLAELGKLIYLLVTGKPFRDLHQLPRDTAPEWQQLVEAEPTWRKLCFDLINPESARPTFEEIDARIAQNAAAGAAAGSTLEFQVAPVVRQKKTGRNIAIAAGVGVVLIGVGVVMLGGNKKSGLAPIVKKIERVEEVPVFSEPDPRQSGWAERDDPVPMTRLQALIQEADALTGKPLDERTRELATLIDAFTARRSEILAMEWNEDTKPAILEAMASLSEMSRQFDAPLDVFAAEVKRAQLVQKREEAERASGLKWLQNQKTALAEGDLLFEATADGPLNQAWARWLDQLIADPTLDESSKEKRGRELRDGLRALNRDVGVEVDPRLAYAELLNSKQKELVRKTMEEVEFFKDLQWQPNEEEVKKRLGSFLEYRSAVETAFSEGTRVGSMIGEGGYALLEEALPGKTLDQVWKEVESIPVFADLLQDQALMGKAPEIRQAVELVAQLRSIAAYTEAKALEDVLARADLSPSTGATAWVALGTALPVNTRDDLLRHLDAFKKVTALRAGIADSDRASQFLIRAERAIRKRWTDAFLKAPDLDTVTALLGDREAAVIDDATIDALPARCKYNLALAEFKATNARLSAPTQRKALTAEKDNFIAAVAAMGPEIQNDPAVSATISGLRAIFEGQKLPKVEDFNEMGPARIKDWTVKVEGADFESVTYTFTPRGRPPVVIDFRQVRIDSTGEVAYIQTTELSIEQANAITVSAGPQSQVMANLPKSNDVGSGVKAWIAGEGRTSPIAVLAAGNRDGTGGGWWPYEPQRSGPPAFPEGLECPPPSASTPLQQAPPRMLLAIAAAAGCRPPTAAEFARAVELEGGWSKSEGVNLRDRTWQRQLQHVMTMPTEPKNKSWPDLGMFQSDLDPPLKENAVAAVDFDDNHLWFWNVEAGGGSQFKNLVGNVSEIVLDSDDGWAPDMRAADAIRVLRPKVRVLGGSAISPRELAPDVPKKPIAAELQSGCSDLGMRLAFPGLQVVNISAKMADVLAGAKVVVAAQ